MFLSVYVNVMYLNIFLQFNMTIYKDDLDQVLAETSTKNKTVIIAIINKAYVEGDKSMFDLFLDSFWLGDDSRALRDHLLIVAVDQTSHDRCKFLQLHCYKLETDGVDFEGEKLYMSDEFIKMMWRRTLFLGDVLKRGYNFIFTWSEANNINTGVYMIRSNNKTIALFDEWYARKDNSTGMKEQDVLEKMMHEGVFRGLRLGVKFLDTLYFSGFCQSSNDVRVVVTVHSNCCRSISAKVADLTAVIHDWKRFKRSSSNETLMFEWSKHTACEHSW
ncbi:hypothetical protein HYC85_013688 [Camellia sinensis]|uniref:Nucleotide-diphospho-sugar transferase domain-containing protein n=1 Tax=Camellia sinensis TaxID=4442 RepID=A0A7J7H648_CAMSI|nr:hypothetical protein HYC85_013688 [Camellia sinensis]